MTWRIPDGQPSQELAVVCQSPKIGACQCFSTLSLDCVVCGYPPHVGEFLGSSYFVKQSLKSCCSRTAFTRPGNVAGYLSLRGLILSRAIKDVGEGGRRGRRAHVLFPHKLKAPDPELSTSSAVPPRVLPGRIADASRPAPRLTAAGPFRTDGKPTNHRVSQGRPGFDRSAGIDPGYACLPKLPRQHGMIPPQPRWLCGVGSGGIWWPPSKPQSSWTKSWRWGKASEGVGFRGVGQQRPCLPPPPSQRPW